MIAYNIFFHHPELHYVEIEMRFSVEKTENIILYLPTWTPGSYMIREYARHIDHVEVKNSLLKIISSTKIDKNNWSFYAETSGEYTVSYRLYCNELTVRTNHVDIDHAMLNGAATFISILGREKVNHQMTIHPPQNWKKISTALPMVQDNIWKRNANNYDELVDSPIEIGNHNVVEFIASGVPHELAIVGHSNVNIDAMVEDLRKIVEREIQLFRKPHPCVRYVFILHHTEKMYGGLEHLNSSLNMLPRWNYEPRSNYLKSISLLSHEYFHLWNIKRIRPIELGPFNYQQENYTRQLWAIEGVTSYYDDYFVFRAGVSEMEEYLKIVAENISTVENTPGDAHQSLTESSWDAWIKYYRQHENSRNTQVSYYVKGATVVTALNLLILHLTHGEKSLDDIMRSLYVAYLKHPEKGYSEDDFLAVCEQIAGVSLVEFFEKHIYGTVPVDYVFYLQLAGLELKNNPTDTLEIGWTLIQNDGKFIASRIDENSSAAFAGLNAEDEIIALNGFRMNSQWENFIGDKNAYDTVPVLVSRGGIIRNHILQLLPNTKKNESIHIMENPSEQQLKVRKAWLGE